PRRLRRYSRRGAEQYDPWAWHAQHHEEPSSIEPPAMNPATGLYMSGPGSTGLDAAGNSYGQSHTNDRAGFWSSDHWG
ncbi:MAG: hypothetical protein U1D69_04175, partial [Polynucleobacter sp.]|nr:hypothetical protein [Polynucleobacter sp.]